jgi:hypothetical protein
MRFQCSECTLGYEGSGPICDQCAENAPKLEARKELPPGGQRIMIKTPKRLRDADATDLRKAMAAGGFNQMRPAEPKPQLQTLLGWDMAQWAAALSFARARGDQDPKDMADLRQLMRKYMRWSVTAPMSGHEAAALLNSFAPHGPQLTYQGLAFHEQPQYPILPSFQALQARWPTNPPDHIAVDPDVPERVLR